MKHLFSIPILLVLVSFLPINSQSFLNLEMINVADQQFQLTNMSKITFTDSSLVLDGEHLLSDVQKITFSETGVGIISKDKSTNKDLNLISVVSHSGMMTLTLPSQSLNTKVAIMDMRGRVLKELVSYDAKRTISIDTHTLSTGIYLTKVKADNNTFTAKFNLVK